MRTSSCLALACLAVLSGGAGAQTFTYTDFSSVAGLNFVGKSRQVGNVLEVMDNVAIAAPLTNGDNRGAAWYAAPVCVAGGFDTTFTYRMRLPSTTGGADGLAFVIQNDMVASAAPITAGSGLPVDGIGNTALGRHAAAGGYGNFATSVAGETVDNSVAIELDTFSNASPWGDPDGNHISIHTGGSGDNGTHESFSIGRANSAAVGGDLNLSNTVRTVRVVYTPGTPGTLEVYWEGALKISAPYDFTTGGTYIDAPGGPVGGLTLIGGTSAYVGFTAGAGTAREFREVLSWTWSSPCAPAPTPFCFGDGSATACPCGNSGASGNGCANSVNAAGGNLSASGTASLAGDTLVLGGSGMPDSSALYFQGTNQMNGGLGALFGDGLRCAGGTIIRLGTKTNVGGASQYPDTGDASVSVRGLVTAPGTRTYQVWYRNAAAFCTPSTFNLTNGVEVTWN